MKNKNLILLLLLLALTTAYNLVNAQTKVGIKAGVNFSNVMLENENGNKGETQTMPGIQLGLTLDIPIAANFFIQPGIMYSKKGFKQKTGGYSGLADNFRVKVSYIEMPINFLYKPDLGDGNLLLGAGPYIGYGLGGTWKSDNTILIGDIMTDNKGRVDFKNDFMDGEFGNYLYGKPLDYGGNILVGYEFLNKLSVQFNAQLGLANLQPKFSEVKRDGSLRNTAFGILLGYKF